MDKPLQSRLSIASQTSGRIATVLYAVSVVAVVAQADEQELPDAALNDIERLEAWYYQYRDDLLDLPLLHRIAERVKADTDDAEAHFWAAVLHLSGQAQILHDEQTAVRALMKAAHGGHAEAQGHLASLYLSGRLVPRETAFEWAEKSAEGQSAVGTFALAMCHLDGAGVAFDLRRGNELLLEAAEKGWPDAQFSLGLRLLEGADGWQRDPAAGLRWVTQAAETGHPEAQRELVVRYERAAGVPQSDVESFRWAVRYAEKWEDPEAQTRVGAMLLTGIGTMRDDGRGVEWLRLAAEQGYADAHFLLAAAVLNRGPEAINESLKWLRSAVDLGHLNAAQHLGMLYLLGVGVDRDIEKGRHLLSHVERSGVSLGPAVKIILLHVEDADMTDQ